MLMVGVKRESVKMTKRGCSTLPQSRRVVSMTSSHACAPNINTCSCSVANGNFASPLQLERMEKKGLAMQTDTAKPLQTGSNACLELPVRLYGVKEYHVPLCSEYVTIHEMAI